jgi:hypothetical protein
LESVNLVGADAVSETIAVTGVEINGEPVAAPAVVEVTEVDPPAVFSTDIEADLSEPGIPIGF